MPIRFKKTKVRRIRFRSIESRLGFSKHGQCKVDIKIKMRLKHIIHNIRTTSEWILLCVVNNNLQIEKFGLTSCAPHTGGLNKGLKQFLYQYQKVRRNELRYECRDIVGQLHKAHQQEKVQQLQFILSLFDGIVFTFYEIPFFADFEQRLFNSSEFGRNFVRYFNETEKFGIIRMKMGMIHIKWFNNKYLEIYKLIYQQIDSLIHSLMLLPDALMQIVIAYYDGSHFQLIQNNHLDGEDIHYYYPSRVRYINNI